MSDEITDDLIFFIIFSNIYKLVFLLKGCEKHIPILSKGSISRIYAPNLLSLLPSRHNEAFLFQ